MAAPWGPSAVKVVAPTVLDGEHGDDGEAIGVEGVDGLGGEIELVGGEGGRVEIDEVFVVLGGEDFEGGGLAAAGDVAEA